MWTLGQFRKKKNNNNNNNSQNQYSPRFVPKTHLPLLKDKYLKKMLLKWAKLSVQIILLL